MRGAPWLIATAALAAITNPVFAHNGATPLFFVGDIAFTLEALLYGAAFGAMLAASVMWGAAESDSARIIGLRLNIVIPITEKKYRKHGIG